MLVVTMSTNHCNPKIGTFQNSARSPYHFAHQKYKYGNFRLIIDHLNLMSTFLRSIAAEREWRYEVGENNNKKKVYILIT